MIYQNILVSPLPEHINNHVDGSEELLPETHTDNMCNKNEEGGFVDMQVSNTVQEGPSEFTSTVCKSLAKLLGHSAELVEFDKVTTSVKSRAIKFPSELHKHKKFAQTVLPQACVQA